MPQGKPCDYFWELKSLAELGIPTLPTKQPRTGTRAREQNQLSTHSVLTGSWYQWAEHANNTCLTQGQGQLLHDYSRRFVIIWRTGKREAFYKRGGKSDNFPIVLAPSIPSHPLQYRQSTWDMSQNIYTWLFPSKPLQIFVKISEKEEIQAGNLSGYYDCTTLVALKPVWASPSAALSVLFIVSANDDYWQIHGTQIPILRAFNYSGFTEPF